MPENVVLRSLLLLGWLPLQQVPPPTPPAPSPPPVTAAKPPLAIDLQRALTAVANARSLRFELVATAPAALRGDTPSPAPAGRMAFELVGVSEVDCPLQLTSSAVEAFRVPTTLVFRTKEQRDWQLQKLEGAPAPSVAGAAAAAPPFATTAPPLFELPHLAHVQTPQQLLVQFDERLTNCVKIDAAEDPSVTIYEGVLSGAMPPLHVRFVLRGDALDELTLFPQPMLRGESQPTLATPPSAPPSAPPSSTLDEFTLVYRVREIGTAHVEVPSEVTRLLAR